MYPIRTEAILPQVFTVKMGGVVRLAKRRSADRLDDGEVMLSRKLLAEAVKHLDDAMKEINKLWDSIRKVSAFLEIADTRSGVLHCFKPDGTAPDSFKTSLWQNYADCLRNTIALHDQCRRASVPLTKLFDQHRLLLPYSVGPAVKDFLTSGVGGIAITKFRLAKIIAVRLFRHRMSSCLDYKSQHTRLHTRGQARACIQTCTPGVIPILASARGRVEQLHGWRDNMRSF